LLLSCAVGAVPADAPDDLVTGVGDKADGAGCEPTSELCWPTIDAEAMRRYLAASDELVLATGDAWEAGQRLTIAVDALAHKLPADARGELLPLRMRAAELSPDAAPEERDALVAEAHRIAGARLLSGYTTANAVPLGASGMLGRADGAPAVDAALPNGQLTDDMRASLDELRATGALGATYAFVLEHYGVLEREYHPVNEAFPFSEPREDRVARIIEHYRWRSAGASVIANAEALIPYAGIVISIAHNALLQLRLRARMVFEIAEVYGLDIREGDNLLVASLVFMACYGMNDVRASVIATTSLPLIIGIVERAASAVTVAALLRRLLREAIRRAIAAVARSTAAAAAEAGAVAVARGAGRQILGYATFGLAMIADIALTTYTTSRVGTHAWHMLRPWGAGMLTEGAGFLAHTYERECVASVLGQMAFADGAIDEHERALLAAHLDRQIFDGGAYRTMNDDYDLGRQAQLAAAATGLSPHYCVDDAFIGEDEEIRLAIVSWARTMAVVDGLLYASEERFALALESRLAGSGYFDGSELETGTLSDVRERIESVLLPQDDGTLLPRELAIEELDGPYPRAAAALVAAGL
jgi:hypothetical protein